MIQDSYSHDIACIHSQRIIDLFSCKDKMTHKQAKKKTVVHKKEASNLPILKAGDGAAGEIRMSFVSNASLKLFRTNVLTYKA